MNKHTNNEQCDTKPLSVSGAQKIAIVVVLVASVIVAFELKRRKSASTTSPADSNAPGTRTTQPLPQPNDTQASKPMPRLVDLGAGKCIPCKMMAPILEELKSEYEGTLIVEFIDVWKNPEEAPKYGIKLIPTQIFFDASGKERFRHEGFMSKEDILAKWKELGINLVGRRKDENPS